MSTKMHEVSIGRRPRPTIYMSELKAGEYAEIADGPHAGTIVKATYHGHRTMLHSHDGFSDGCPQKVYRLPPGTVIKITVGKRR